MLRSLIQVGATSLEEFEVARLAVNADNFTDEGWDRVMFTHDSSFACRHVVAVGNWDEDRRQLVRSIIGQARHNFHVHPRPWWVKGIADAVWRSLLGCSAPWCLGGDTITTL